MASNHVRLKLSVLLFCSCCRVISLCTNVSSSSEELPALWYLQVVYIITIIVLALMGNSIIFVVICVNRRLQRIDNIFVANLAISDFLFTFFETCSNVTRKLNRNWRPPHYVLCYVIMASSVLCASASAFTQTAVAVNRYIAVCRPLHYPNIVRKRRVLVSISVIWVCAVALASPPLTWRSLTVICSEEESYDSHVTSEIVYMGAEWILIFVVPFGIMSTIYYRIYHIAADHAQRVRSFSMSSTNSTTRNHILDIRSECKAAKMLVIIAGAFFISWFPFFVTLTFWKFHDESIHMHPKIFTGFLYLIYTLPAVNPAIYAIWCRDIRLAIKKMFRCCK